MLKSTKIIIFLFLFVFILNAGKNIFSIPLHDFDEANRAEGAKNMKRY